MFNFKLRAKLRKVFGANKVFLHGRCGTKNHSQGRILRGLALPEVAISQLRLATFRSSFRSRPFLQAMFPNGARRHFCSSKKKADDKSDSDYKSGGDKEDMPKKRPSLPMVFTTIYLLCLAVVASSMLTSRNSETARDLRRSTPVSFTKLAQRVVAGEVAKVVVVSNVTALAYSKDGQTVLSTSLAGAEQPERLLGDLQRNAGVPPSRQVPVFLPFLSQTDSPRRRVTADAGGCDLAGRARRIIRLSISRSPLTLSLCFSGRADAPALQRQEACGK